MRIIAFVSLFTITQSYTVRSSVNDVIEANNINSSACIRDVSLVTESETRRQWQERRAFILSYSAHSSYSVHSSSSSCPTTFETEPIQSTHVVGQTLKQNPFVQPIGVDNIEGRIKWRLGI